MRRRLSLVLAFSLGIAGSCKRDPGADEGKVTKEQAKRLIAEYEKKKKEVEARAAKKRAAPASSAAPITEPSGSTAPSASASPAGPEDESKDREEDAPWFVDEAVAIAPAAPLTATVDGVVLHDRMNNVHLARLGGLSRRDRPMKTPVAPPPGAKRRFPLGRGPAIAKGYAYWTSEGKLLRRKIPLRGEQGPLEVLQTDAQTGTRVAVAPWPRSDPKEKSPVLAAYITRPAKKDGPLRAKLWVEGGETRLLTPEGNSTHSVSLVQAGKGILAFSVQARMAMTPVHARRITLEGQTPHLGTDVVAWVGGGVQPLTEMAVLEDEGRHLWGFIPHERSITEFGLAILDLGLEPNMNTSTEWFLYPNGLDPAPVATGRVCGEPAVVYAQPENADPDAPQELVLRTMTERERGSSIAKAKGFFSVSMQEVPGGALVAYVADWASWACTVRCRRRSP